MRAAFITGHGGNDVVELGQQPRAVLEQAMDELVRIEGPCFVRGNIGNLLT
jgi:hypothetical protein